VAQVEYDPVMAIPMWKEFSSPALKLDDPLSENQGPLNPESKIIQIYTCFEFERGPDLEARGGTARTFGQDSDSWESARIEQLIPAEALVSTPRRHRYDRAPQRLPFNEARRLCRTNSARAQEHEQHGREPALTSHVLLPKRVWFVWR